MMGERLSEEQIFRFLRNHPKSRHVFLECVPSDEIKKARRHPYALIVNTDNSRGQGIHWTAFFVTSPNSVEYFDSFGQPPQGKIKEFYESFNHRKRSIEYLQSPFSNSCGPYALYFVLRRCGGISFDRIIDSLKLHRSPDSVVTQWFNRLRDYAR
jgi:hypothetical protein